MGYITYFRYTYLNIDFRSLPDNISSSKPCVNVSPYSTATITKSPKSQPAPVDPIQQLINQVTSQNIETSKNALTSLDKMLLRSDVRFISINYIYSNFILKCFRNKIYSTKIHVNNNFLNFTYFR